MRLQMMGTLAGAGLLLAQAWAADSVESLAGKGVQAFKAGNNQEAVAALQQAITLIQQQTNKGLEKWLPAAPNGWTAGEIESTSGSFQGADGKPFDWTNVERRYNRAADEAEATIVITTSPLLVDAQKGMIEAYRNNPAMLQVMAQNADVKFSLLEKSGWNGYRQVSKDSDATIVLFKDGTMLSISLNNGDGEALDAFYNGISFKGVAKNR